MSDDNISLLSRDLDLYNALTLDKKLEWHIDAWNMTVDQFKCIDAD